MICRTAAGRYGWQEPDRIKNIEQETLNFEVRYASSDIGIRLVRGAKFPQMRKLENSTFGHTKGIWQMFAKKLIRFGGASVVFCCGVFAGADTGQLGVKIERNVPVPMRDGTILRADVHRPDRGGPYPVLVQRTPYGKDANFSPFVKAGYIVVSQDVRGRYDSEGKWESLIRPKTHDGEDGYDTIEWAARLGGSTGKVGTFGGSYCGFLQWRLAPLHPPSLVAMSANAIAARHTYYRRNGVILPHELVVWVCSFSPEMRRRANRPGVHTTWEACRLWNGGESEKWYRCFPMLELPEEVFEDETTAMKDYLQNPSFDPLRLDEGCREIAVPNLEFSGWYDMSNGDMLMYQTMAREGKTEIARKGSQLIIGPWGHLSSPSRYGDIDFGLDAGLDWTAEQIRWFDYWLKGIQNGVDKDPPVRLFVMGDNEWRNEQHWPLQRAKDKVFYITSASHANTPEGDGRLVEEEGASPGTDAYTYDPNDPVPSPGGSRLSPADQRPLAHRKDILVYQTPPLTEHFEVTGNPVVELYASSTAPDTDWFVQLIDVYPDGLAFNVAHGIIRARYRNGLDKPELIRPGEIVKYMITMMPTSNAFLPGHRIRLDITSSYFPNYDRSYNTAAGPNVNATWVTARQTVHHGGERATRIILPWIPNPTREEPAAQTKPASEQQTQTHPLHLAAAGGNAEQIASLLAQGADVNAKDGQGRTPLHHAVKSGGKEPVRMLVEAGADVQALDKDDVTPLHAAAESGNKDVVEILVANGADINTKDKWLWSPLHYAAWKGHRDVAEALIAEGSEINVKDDSGFSPLHYAVQYGHKDVVELLIAKGADINAKDNDGITPLGHALLWSHRDIAGLFFAKITDFASKDYRGLTALHSAAVEGYADIVELLLSKGAEVDERDDNYEFTALHYATRFGNKNVAEVLIAHGADIKAKDKWDYEPIHWAAYHDRPEIIELLIAKGADVSAKTSLGQTPLELAIPMRNTAAIEVLRKHGAK
jgi:putative CocE/NonD family hydrolase